MQYINSFFTSKKINPLPYQQQSINAYNKNKHGLIDAPTGRGKTLAMALAIISSAQKNKKKPTILWVTPMRALARDTTAQLKSTFEFFYPDINIVLRTSDSTSYQKQKARKSNWDILITTPESCALLSTYDDMISSLSKIDCIVIDEWHSLLHQKRGILLELFLSWLHFFNPTIKRWALSATISNTAQAINYLCHFEHVECIKDPYKKTIKSDILLPENDTTLYHNLGKFLLPQMIAKIKSVKSTIIFTNTRSQSEQWYQLLLDSKQFKKNQLALHHSAIDNTQRHISEEGLKTGKIKCIVATSSLDLGVDLKPVDLVLHIGSAKGLARLKQRAGRSGHSPFESPHIIMVPRNGLELIEAIATQKNINNNSLSTQTTPYIPTDVLTQHIINICMSHSFTTHQLITMCHTTQTFKQLHLDHLNWILDFCCNKHTILKAYDQYTKLNKINNSYHTNTTKQFQQTQRFNIGAITSHDTLILKFKNQKTIGTIEEQFIRQLNPSDTFLFAGHVMKIVSIIDNIVYVKKSSNKRPKYTRWIGGNMLYSSQLSDFLLNELDTFINTNTIGNKQANNFLKKQQTISTIPQINQCLIEITTYDQCTTIFIYLFCGRHANQALAMCLNYILSLQFKCQIATSINDYAIMLQFDGIVDTSKINFKTYLTIETINNYNKKAFNQNEMILQEFRHICMIAGLINKGLPGKSKTSKYNYSSIKILYDIFKEHDPKNLFLQQAFQTIFNQQLLPSNLEKKLTTIKNNIIINHTSTLSPFASSLYNEQLQSKMQVNET